MSFTIEFVNLPNLWVTFVIFGPKIAFYIFNNCNFSEIHGQFCPNINGLSKNEQKKVYLLKIQYHHNIFQ